MSLMEKSDQSRWARRERNGALAHNGGALRYMYVVRQPQELVRKMVRGTFVTIAK
jgi:hypothetical protein